MCVMFLMFVMFVVLVMCSSCLSYWVEIEECLPRPFQKHALSCVDHNKNDEHDEHDKHDRHDKDSFISTAVKMKPITVRSHQNRKYKHRECKTRENRHA
jgi:hypothetical protein